MDIKKLYRAKPYLPKEDRQWIQAAWKDILFTGMFIQGKYVKQFEDAFADREFCLYCYRSC